MYVKHLLKIRLKKIIYTALYSTYRTNRSKIEQIRVETLGLDR
jgi:hypothetical protein